MKKILLVLVLVGIVAVVFFNSGSAEKTTQTLTPIESGVFVVSQTKESAVKEPEVVSAGDKITTDATGTALLEGGHNTYLDPSSALLVKEISTNGSVFALELGKLWARTQKVFEKGEYYEIETSNTRVAVRGTSFGVLLGSLETTVLVTEGNVLVWQKNPQTGEVILESEVVVLAGEKVVVSAEGIVKSLIDEADHSEWFLKYSSDLESEGELEVVQAQEGESTLNFPSSVPIYPGSTLGNVSETEQDGVQNITMTLSVRATVSDVNTWYRRELGANGWSLVSDQTVGGYVLLKGENGNVTVFMQAARGSDGFVTITERVRVEL